MKLYEYHGEQYTLGELAKIATNGIKPHNIMTRLNVQHMTVEEAITIPVHHTKTYEYKGKWLTVSEISQLTHCRLSTSMLRYRLNKKHMTVEEAISTEPGKRIRHRLTMECGATSPFDCLNCQHEDMPCLSNGIIMPGEGAGDYVFTDYGKR